jgi:hypothetical protein
MKQTLHTFSFHFAVFCALFAVLATANAQVVINEFSAANYSQNTDNFGENEDWIELFNTTAAPINLAGWHLSDRAADPLKWTFPAGTTIAANGFLRVWCSGRNTGTGANMHSNFKLNQTQNVEVVLLSNAAGTVIDINNMDIPNQMNHSWGRSPNGSANWRVFTAPTPNASNTTANYLGYATTPNITPASGSYGSPLSVSITTPDTGVSIRYTTNGDFPTATSTLYSGAFNITQTRVIRAIAISSNPAILPSFSESNTYFINVAPHTCKIISLSGAGTASLLAGNSSTPLGGFEMFDQNFVKIDEGYGELNKHGNDSWAYSQRGVDFIMRDQLGYDYAVQEQIFQSTPRNKFQRIILKPAANDNYPFQAGGAYIRDAFVHTLSERCALNLDERKWEPCVLYLNGQYWGVYEIREKVDDSDYTDYYYNYDGDEIDYIKTWGGTWAEYGDLTQWNTLYNYIMGNNMAIPANYTNATNQLNILSLMDYVIINTQTVCSDWLNYNTSWWHSNDNGVKWRYALWDMDATFDHYINYTSIPSQEPTADPCDVEAPMVNDPQGHIELLTKLMENPDAYDLYVNRYADLNNSCFSCPYMLALLDSMIAEIQPEMPRQIARWGGNMATWNNNVQALRNFIQTRCTVIDQGIVDCYSVTGPYTVTIIINGDGTIQVNTITVNISPWTGDYFGNNPIDLSAIASGTGQFINWTMTGGTITDPTNPNITINLTGNVTITANFASCTPPASCNDGICSNGQEQWNGTTCACETIAGTIPTPCTDDGVCSNGTETWDNNTCTCSQTNVPTPCTNDGVCSNGTETWDNNTCTCTQTNVPTPCTDDGVCSNGVETWDNNTCTCTQTNVPTPCTDDGVCSNGVETWDNNTCTCTQTNVPTPCTDDGVCSNGVETWDNNTCTCTQTNVPTPCTDDGVCSNGTETWDNNTCTCSQINVPTPCTDDGVCSNGTETWDNNTCTCTQINVPTPCTDDGVCSNGTETWDNNTCTCNIIRKSMYPRPAPMTAYVAMA